MEWAPPANGDRTAGAALEQRLHAAEQALLEAVAQLPHSAKIQFGAVLAVDGTNETFSGSMSGRANPLLTREYRKGFEVPASAQLV